MIPKRYGFRTDTMRKAKQSSIGIVRYTKTYNSVN